MDGSVHTFLTIGSHAIRKMDYTMANFNHNIKYLEENAEIRKRLKDNLNIADIRSIIYNNSSECSKVLVLRKNEKNRFESTNYPYTERRATNAHLNNLACQATHRLERVLTSK